MHIYSVHGSSALARYFSGAYFFFRLLCFVHVMEQTHTIYQCCELHGEK